MNRMRCVAGLALMTATSPAMALPPDATAYQITVDHAGVTTSGSVLALHETPRWSVHLTGPTSFPIIAGGVQQGGSCYDYRSGAELPD
jgi:hypothetical protein